MKDEDMAGAKEIRNSAVKIIPQRPESITVEVFKTKDYKKFELAKENRPIYEKHVKKLEKSLGEHGFLADSPVRVVRNGDKLTITDGQHRFLAAQNLGIELLYVLSREDDPFSDIQIHHTYQRSWSFSDYVHHYVQRGYPDVVRFKKIMDDFRMPPSVTIDLMNLVIGARKGNALSRQSLKTGDLKISAESEELVRHMFARVNEIRFLHDRMRPMMGDQRFIRAIGHCVAHRDYDHERMISALSRQLMSVVTCGNMDDYLKMLTDIYNHQRRAENRVVFQRAQEHLKQKVDIESL